MPDKEHERIFLSGVATWNEWRQNNRPSITASLEVIHFYSKK